MDISGTILRNYIYYITHVALIIVCLVFKGNSTEMSVELSRNYLSRRSDH